VLAHHLIANQALVFGDEERHDIIMSDGRKVKVEATQEYVRIDSAFVLEEEIVCANGIIHVIDMVLLPREEKQQGK
jgi:uncharacterized surface protein with fasciclin (FAS1) repeats